MGNEVKRYRYYKGMPHLREHSRGEWCFYYDYAALLKVAEELAMALERQCTCRAPLTERMRGERHCGLTDVEHAALAAAKTLGVGGGGP